MNQAKVARGKFMNMGKLKKHFYKFLDYLKGRPLMGGLEVSDSTLRFAYFNGKVWKLESIKVPGGILKAGQFADRDKFLEILKRFKNQIPISIKAKKKISVVVSLSFSGVYTQVLNLPMLRDKNLEEAATLNLEMTSPLKQEESYIGWQVIGKDESAMKVDILGAFIARKQVDQISSVLKEVGFMPIAAEPKALALARLIREQAVGFDRKKPYVVLVLDNENLSFLILKNGELYFEYTNSWAELRGDKKEISLLDFKSLITLKLRQVINFYTQHSPEKISEVIVISLGLKQEIKNIIRENFSLGAVELQLRFDKPLEVEWFAALGSAIRAEMPRRTDQNLSLLGASMKEEFRRQEIVSFLSFWRIFLASTLGFAALIFIGSYVFLIKMEGDLKGSLGETGSREAVEAALFREDANRFNTLVGLISSIRKSGESKALAIKRVSTLLSEQGLTLTQFNFLGYNKNLTLQGRGRSQADFFNFEERLRKEKDFSNINFSFTDVVEDNQGVSFKISFSMTPANSP